MKELNYSLADLLKESAGKHEKGITFIGGENQETFVSYQELYRVSSVVLKNLQRHGLRKGDELVILLKDNFELLTAFWACILGGIIPVPLSFGNQKAQRDRIFNILDLLNRPAVICDSDIRLKLEEGATLTERQQHSGVPLLSYQTVAVDDGHGELCSAGPNDTAYIQFSSGSTGSPKGVTLTHRNLYYNTTDIATRSAMTATDAILSWMPLTHDMGLICFHLTGVLMKVNQYIMPTDLFIRRPLLWMEVAARYRITQLYSPNFGLHYFTTALLDAPRKEWDLSAVRLIYNGAEPISADICRKFMQALAPYGLRENAMFPGYGMAEACVAVSLPQPGTGLQSVIVDRTLLNTGDRVAYLGAGQPDALELVLVGAAIDHCNIRICDARNKPVEAGIAGRIQIKGDNVTAGYYNDPQSTRKTMTNDRWLITGDLGFLHEGQLVITGREKNLIIINGQNYFPYDIERALGSLEGLETGKLAAAGIRDVAGGEEKLVIYVLFKKKTAQFLPVIEQVKETVYREFGIAVWKVLAVSKIPKTTSGKLQYYKLKADFDAGLFDQQMAELEELQREKAAGAPADISGTAATIRAIASELLPPDQVALAEDIFAAGLNSLTAIQFANRLTRAFNVEISLPEVLNNKEISRLAAVIQNKARNGENPLAKVTAPSAGDELLPVQKRFWVWQHIHPEKRNLHVNIIYAISGTIVVDRFIAALATVIAAQESLRTVFPSRNETPYPQLTHPDINDIFSFVDISGAPEGQRAFEKFSDEERERAFDLRNGPLLRVTLFDLGNNAYRLYVAVHHIVFDGWSEKLFINHLLSSYHNEARSMAPQYQFRGFVHYKTAASREMPAASKAYWLKEFEAEVPRLELPLPKAPDRYQKTAPFVARIPQPLYDHLIRMSRENGITLFSALMALVDLLLFKYTGQQDIVTGTVSAGRDALEWEDQVGCFINTFPVRTVLSSTTTFTALARQVQEKIMAGVQHQHYPYESLLDDLGAYHGQRYTELFNVLVLFQDLEQRPAAGEEAAFKVDALELDTPYTLADLQFDFVLSQQALKVELRFNEELYHMGQIESLGNHLLFLAKQVCADPHKPLTDYTVLMHDELQQLQRFAGGVQSGTAKAVIGMFEDAGQRMPRARALTYESVSFTYEELNRQVNALAVNISRRLPVVAGNRIVVLVPRSHKLVIALLAIWKTANTYIPVDDSFPDERIAFIIRDSGANAVYTTQASWEKLKQGFPDLLFINCFEYLPALRKGMTADTVPADAESAAYILYTSGTTGTPKGVVIPHRAINDYVHTFIRYFNITQTDVVIQQASVSFDTSLEEILPVLCQGGRLVIAGKGGSDVEQLVDIIRREQVTVVSTTPLVVRELSKAFLPECLRAVISGGDILRREHIAHFPHRIKVYNTYGPTETTICATYKDVTGRDEIISIGRPNPNHRVYLLNDAFELVPKGAVGEICISGKGVATGYVNNPEEENKRFVPDPFHAGKKMYRTGDMGFWNNDGELIILGRKDQQIKIRGYRIELKEVERCITAFEQVADAVVRCEEIHGEAQLVAYCQPAQQLAVEALQAWLGRFLPGYMVPAIYIVLETLPLLPSGKTDVRSLSARLETYLNSRPTDADVSNQTEARLLDIWRTVLEVDNINVKQNFFSLGGNSIKAMRMIGIINDTLGRELTIQEVFSYPTVREMAAVLERKKSVVKKGPEYVDAGGFYELSHAQKRIWLLHQVHSNEASANICAALDLEGALDTAKFRQAYLAVIAQHEMLRTFFTERGLVIGQTVAKNPEEACVLEEIDMREAADPAQAALLFIQQQSQRAFRLDVLPLAKSYLIRTGHARYIFFVTVHHIIADGWSMKLIFDALFTGYNQLCAGRQPDGEPSDYHYRDFAAWHNRLAATQGKYWMDLYHDGVPDTLLPTDFPRVQGVYTGDTVRGHLDAELITRLQQVAVNANTTLDIILFAAYSMVIAGWCRQSDIVIGLLVSGRNHLITRNMVGVFINTLPVRVNIGAGQHLGEFIRELHRRLMEAFNHQDYPFDQMVEHIEGGRFRGKNPFYQTLFNYQPDESYIEGTQVTGLVVEKLPLSFNDSMIDIQLNLLKQKEGMSVEFCFNAALYEKATIAALNQQFGQLLHHIAGTMLASPDELLAAIGLPLAQPQAAPVTIVKYCASFVMEPVSDALRYWSEQADMEIRPVFAAYNQVMAFLLNEANCRRDKDAARQVTVIAVRPEDWLRLSASLPPDAGKKLLHDTYNELLSAYENFIQRCDHPVIALIPPANERQKTQDTDIALVTAKWKKYLIDTGRTIVLDMEDLIASYELEQVFDPVADEMAHIPFTDELYTAIGTEIVRVLYAQESKPYKVIVLDADNTLWGGICGEDPLEQIIIDDGYTFLQEFMIEKYNQGFLLALCSKNNEADCWRVFDHHPGMKLKRHHLITHRINWKSKADNIASIAAELNLGPDAFIFLDDSAHEQAEVGTRRPEVLSLQLPAESTQIRSFLQHVWAFDRYTLTREDLKRNEHYRAEISRKSLQASAASMEDYITSLHVKTTLLPLTEEQLDRVSQLTKRTNQFNANGIEWSKDDLREFISHDGNIARAVYVEDRFGDYGLAGAVLLRKDAGVLLVESMLLSCRVLGRGVEYYLKKAIEEEAQSAALSSIKLKAWETGRNHVFFEFLKDAGWMALLPISNIQQHEKD